MQYCGNIPDDSLEKLLTKYQMTLVHIAQQQAIPGSHWGDSEAGLIDHSLYVRDDTPVHSALHETCHYICMDHQRRQNLHTDAGGDYDEENAVCYLQILLAEFITNNSQQLAMQEMDEWGYSFRLGSTAKWFYQDADDARRWLEHHAIIDASCNPTFNLRN